MKIRDALPSDLPTILTLNQAELPHVSSVTLEELKELHEEAIYHKVAEVDGKVAAFLLGMDSKADYPSLNYQWFLSHYDSFIYIDRIVVAPWAQHQRIGRSLYEDIETFTRSNAPVLTCEVNIRPPNDYSLLFHKKFGFQEVGQQETEGGKKKVSLLVKKMEDNT